MCTCVQVPREATSQWRHRCKGGNLVENTRQTGTAAEAYILYQENVRFLLWATAFTKLMKNTVPAGAVVST